MKRSEGIRTPSEKRDDRDPAGTRRLGHPPEESRSRSGMERPIQNDYEPPSAKPINPTNRFAPNRKRKYRNNAERFKNQRFSTPVKRGQNHKKISFPKTSGMKSLEDNYLFFSTQFEMNRG
ncbi:hypothetical protein ABER02_22665 [Rossellomorea marisflavi]|uniref:hypothetical protein n=1 Tax=Rossellomorea marisflavi TaxID=189381 RepID=UPI003D2A82D3